MSKRLTATVALGALLATLPVAARADVNCVDLRPRTWAEATGKADMAGDLRVYAIQFKHEVRYVQSYQTFTDKMRCIMDEMVMQTADANGDGTPDRPTIVVFNEDIGLATIATGTRGAAARAIAQFGSKDPQNITGALAAFGTLGGTFAPAIAHYAAAEPETSPQRLILAAATDVFARGMMRTFSDIARDYGVYVVASNNQAEFRETSNPAAVAALADPDLAARYATGELTSVYEAIDVDAIPESVGLGRAGIDVANQAWMWAPDTGVTSYAAARFAGLGLDGEDISASDPRANVIAVNKKTPLTSIEREVLDLTDDRDMSAANTGPFFLPATADPSCTTPGPACKIRIGFGISLPSFKWGSRFGEPFTGDPCTSPDTWMRCLDARGVTLFLQPEANPGRWADYIDVSWTPTAYQSLSWLDSAWRAVADPTVTNIRYAVTPHLVGNLADLTFDGQSAIFERCLPRPDGSTTCSGNTPENFVGAQWFIRCNGQVARCDSPDLEPYTGHKAEALVLAPWVMEDDVDPPLGNLTVREMMAERSRQMEAGSLHSEENNYLETAIWADLDFD